MKQINYENSNYNYKEELKTFLSSFNDLIDKYNKSFDSKHAVLNKINADINRKKSSINKLESNGEELAKREEELKSLKASTTSDIKELEMRKKNIDYTDSVVMKMEKEDLDVLISSKKGKLTKIDEKMDVTRAKLSENKDSKITSQNELKNLEDKKKEEEESLYKTQAILKLTIDAKEKLNDSVYDVLNSAYQVLEEKENDTNSDGLNDTEDIVLNPSDLTATDDSKALDDVSESEEVIFGDEDLNFDFDNDFDSATIELDEPMSDITPEVEAVQEEKRVEDEKASELSILDFDDIELPHEVLPNSDSLNNDDVDYHRVVEDTFKKDGIDYKLFDEPTQIKLVENADNVLKNITVLKKHQVPLELTLKQPKIYYAIEPQDLEDLLNIITTDEDGNGMGFSIDYVFYVLNELAQINVDKLIDVYNNEFMNVNSKSGLIKLLKMVDNNLGDFENNREINLETLRSLGITNVDEIKDKYKEFVDLDNPLFLAALNLFDKEDLVRKINSDIKIIPKIMDYWLNN